MKSSNVVYLERKLAESFLSNYHQGWMSQEAQAEAYNETWRESDEVKLVQKFLEENPHVGAQFNKQVRGTDRCVNAFMDIQRVESVQSVHNCPK